MDRKIGFPQPLNINLGKGNESISFMICGKDNLELSFNTKRNVNSKHVSNNHPSWISPPSNTRRRIQRLCNTLAKDGDQLNVNIPRKQMAPFKSGPVIIESDNLKNFRAAFHTSNSRPVLKLDGKEICLESFEEFKKQVEDLFDFQMNVLGKYEKLLNKQEKKRRDMAQNLYILKTGMHKMNKVLKHHNQDHADSQESVSSESEIIVKQPSFGIGVDKFRKREVHRTELSKRKSITQRNLTNEAKNPKFNKKYQNSPVSVSNSSYDRNVSYITTTQSYNLESSLDSNQSNQVTSESPNKVPFNGDKITDKDLNEINQTSTETTTVLEEKQILNVGSKHDAMPQKSTFSSNNVLKQLAESMRKSHLLLDAVHEKDNQLGESQKIYYQAVEGLYDDQQRLLAKFSNSFENLEDMLRDSSKNHTEHDIFRMEDPLKFETLNDKQIKSHIKAIKDVQQQVRRLKGSPTFQAADRKGVLAEKLSRADIRLSLLKQQFHIEKVIRNMQKSSNLKDAESLFLPTKSIKEKAIISTDSTLNEVTDSGIVENEINFSKMETVSVEKMSSSGPGNISEQIEKSFSGELKYVGGLPNSQSKMFQSYLRAKNDLFLEPQILDEVFPRRKQRAHLEAEHYKTQLHPSQDKMKEGLVYSENVTEKYVRSPSRSLSKLSETLEKTKNRLFLKPEDIHIKFPQDYRLSNLVNEYREKQYQVPSAKANESLVYSSDAVLKYVSPPPNSQSSSKHEGGESSKIPSKLPLNDVKENNFDVTPNSVLDSDFKIQEKDAQAEHNPISHAQPVSLNTRKPSHVKQDITPIDDYKNNGTKITTSHTSQSFIPISIHDVSPMIPKSDSIVQDISLKPSEFSKKRNLHHMNENTSKLVLPNVIHHS